MHNQQRPKPGLENMKRLPARRANTRNVWPLCWQGVAVAAAAVTCYYPSLRGGLVFDDIAAIKDNRDIRPHSPLSNLFIHDFWGTPIYKEQSHKSYRPLTVLSFRWNYWIHGLDPWGYHLINIILHAIVSFLYLRFCRQILRANDALVAALLFAVHPIHTDAVSSVVGRAELLSAVFFLLALLSYWRLEDSERGTVSKRVWSTVAVPIVLSALGTLCKEQALTALVVCAASELLILNKVPLNKSFLQCLLNFRSKTFLWYRSIVERVRLLLAAFVTLLFLRMVLMGRYFPSFNRLDNPSSVASSDTRMFTYNHLVSLNAWFLLFPNPLSCDWSSESIPLVTTITDWRNLGTLSFYAVLIRLLYQALRHRSYSSRVIKTILLLAAIPFLPATNLFFPVGFVIAERVLYLPSMGFCILVAYGRSLLKTDHYRKMAINVGLSILLLFHALKTSRRCLDWESEYTLYKTGIDANPRNVKLLNNMGRLLEKWGQTHDALRFYISAVSVHPDDVNAYLNLGNAYTSLQRFQEAEEAYVKATALLPKAPFDDNETNKVTVQHLKALLRLATLISRNSSRLDEADKLYAKAVSLRTDYTEAYVGWGSLMLRTNRTREAEFVLGKALQQDGQDPNMLYNLGIVLAEQGKTSKALAFFDRALSLDPNHEPSLLASARLIQTEGLHQLQDVATERLRKIIEIGQADETVYFSLGMISLKIGNHKEGEQWLRKAIEMKKDFPEALFNIALLLYDDGRPEESKKFLHNLLQNKGDHVKGLLLLGDINVNYMDDLKTAEDCYRRVLNVDPKNYQSLHNLCVVHMKRHELKRAVACFQEASGLAPHVDYIQRHLQLTDLLLRQGIEDVDSETINGSDVATDITKRLRHVQLNQ